MNQALGQVRSDLLNAERARAAAHGELAQQVREMQNTSQQLRDQTGQLVNALYAPQIRGRWGEVQLRRLVESAGMLDHVDFVQQQSIPGDGAQLRPDMVVRLSGDKNIVLDAKVPFQGYLAAMATENEQERNAQLARHAKHLRQHVQQLAAKEYWNFVPQTPEFVVMFVPAEGFVISALEADPGLWDYAFASNVIIATPATLLALLRTVAHTWRQERMSEQARQVLQSGKELHRRLSTVGNHLTNLSKKLNATVEAFNTLNSSLDARLAPSARRFSELQGLEPPQITTASLQVAAQGVNREDFFSPSPAIASESEV